MDEQNVNEELLEVKDPASIIANKELQKANKASDVLTNALTNEIAKALDGEDGYKKIDLETVIMSLNKVYFNLLSTMYPSKKEYQVSVSETKRKIDTDILTAMGYFGKEGNSVNVKYIGEEIPETIYLRDLLLVPPMLSDDILFKKYYSDAKRQILEGKIDVSKITKEE